MTNKTSFATLYVSTPKNPNMRCRLSVSDRFTANLGPDSPLHPDTAAYGACRFLARCRPAQRLLVPLSYQMRIAAKRSRKGRTLWLQLDPVCFALPAGSAAVYVRLAVSADGVTVEQAEVLPPHAPTRFRVEAAYAADGTPRPLL